MCNMYSLEGLWDILLRKSLMPLGCFMQHFKTVLPQLDETLNTASTLNTRLLSSMLLLSLTCTIYDLTHDKHD